MRKFLTALLAALLFSLGLSAQEVPRYTGFAAGGFIVNQYGLGGWSDYAPTMLGAGGVAEYTLPEFLPGSLDMGLSAHLEAAHLFENTDSTLESGNDVSVFGGLWLRVPFMAFGQYFAFQPELGGGVAIHFADIKNKGSGVYTDPVISFAPAMRWIPQNLTALEVELAPLYTFAPEKADYSLSQLGFRVGAVWHFDGAYNTDGAENPKKAEKKAKQIKKMEEELSDGYRAMGFDMKVVVDFTPDGDGSNDRIILHPKLSFLSDKTESWKVVITDPAGNEFKTITGNGKLPKEIIWDGVGNNGDKVFSNNVYNATLTAVPSKKDREMLSVEEISTSAPIKTGTILESTGENEWKVSVQSLVFDPNAATFNTLTDEQKADMDRTIEGLVSRLNNIRGAHVTIYGYANNVNNTQQEEEEELIPLSQARADAVAQLLSERGISENLISAKGMGSANPIAAWDDKANWWKNRRIEFVIKK